MRLPSSRSEAKKQGCKRYFTDLPCKYGHFDKRLTSDGSCFECNRIKRFRRYQENPEIYKAVTKLWRQENPLRKREQVARRRANKKQATPKWVSTKELVKIYENCPLGYQVDHEVPLSGQGVCGLHVPWNLQYLTIQDNRKKYNNYEIY